MKKSGLIIAGGLTATIGAILLARKKSVDTTTVVSEGISGKGPGILKVHLTGYWPFSAKPEEIKMEGGIKDRKGNPLHTLEMHQSDPASHPFVSLAGDYEIWPYGQRLILSPWPDLIFRIVDTGSHFHGTSKVYRVMGEEPIDVCVNTSSTKVPKSNVTAKIVVGDSFETGKSIAVAKLEGQSVALSGFESLFGD